ncbi:M28 family peptidase [Chitinophaga sp. SYP-B3965]|uniref:M28 family peptidase n=1 Tax=Chitinophaga sp. SYP-B3965 TaxID=2663120 RepID=UPI001299AB15|nr:M28 family peptidase [Chitinophaga sp. SYP-B3965]MRG46828.1 M28 family peptidase [Chitinophaga sp. SYP-B3965]
MKKFTFIACLVASGTVACAQMAKPPVKPVAATPFAKGITAADLKKHLYIVAGNDMEGRETGKPGQHKAAKYISEQFKRVGLQPAGIDGSWEQPFSLFTDTLITGKIVTNGRTLEFGQDFYNGLRENKNQTLGATGVVFAGYGISNEKMNSYDGLDVTDKIVLLAEGEPMDAEGKPLFPKTASTLKDKLRAAGGKGAKAVFLVSSNVSQISRAGSRLRKTGLYFNDEITTMEYIPNSYYISPDMATTILSTPFKELQESLKKPTPTKASGQITELVYEKGLLETKSSNVLGMLPGTDKKDEYLFITAHYDHIGVINGKIHNGADDDGSGTVSVIAMAEAFMKAKKAGKGPRRTIVFMTVAGEEKGLLGSRYYTEHPIYPLGNTVADLNIDMIGRIDPEHAKDTNYVYIIGDDKLSSDLRPINEAANMQTGLKLDYKYNDPNDPNRFYYRSDHYMFAQKKIPIIFYFNGVHPDYHGAGDTPDKIHYPMLAKRAQLVFYTAWEVANRADRIKVDRNEK